jgi:photosystem II stability/assembly factor-like uncharacterized protein
VRLGTVDADRAYLVGVCMACSEPGVQQQGTVAVGVAGDSGQAWQRTSAIPGVSGGALLSAVPTVAFPTPERGWLVAPTVPGALLVTTDGGATWTSQRPE